MKPRLATFAIGTALMIAGCGGDSPTNGGTPPPPPPPPPGPTPDVTIVVDEIAFIDPDGTRNQDFSLTIDLGDRVEFDNQDVVAHTVTSSDEPAGGTPFDEPLGVGESAVIEPDARGTWTFFCEIHPGIMFDATIIVN